MFIVWCMQQASQPKGSHLSLCRSFTCFAFSPLLLLLWSRSWHSCCFCNYTSESWQPIKSLSLKISTINCAFIVAVVIIVIIILILFVNINMFNVMLIVICIVIVAFVTVTGDSLVVATCYNEQQQSCFFSFFFCGDMKKCKKLYDIKGGNFWNWKYL